MTADFPANRISNRTVILWLTGAVGKRYRKGRARRGKRHPLCVVPLVLDGPRSGGGKRTGELPHDRPGLVSLKSARHPEPHARSEDWRLSCCCNGWRCRGWNRKVSGCQNLRHPHDPTFRSAPPRWNHRRRMACGSNPPSHPRPVRRSREPLHAEPTLSRPPQAEGARHVTA